MLKILTVWKGNPILNYEWVLKIQQGVSRNLDIPHEHICLTDDKLDFCKTIPFDSKFSDTEKYWYKMNMYRDHTELSGPCLYFDLDMVIVDNITKMVKNLLENTTDSLEIWGARSPFVPANLPDTDYFNSSILFWKKNPIHLWPKFLEKPSKKWKSSTKTEHTHGDQAFVANHCKFGFVNDYCPNHYIEKLENYKPNETSIIFFAGKRKPNGFLHNELIKNNWRYE